MQRNWYARKRAHNRNALRLVHIHAETKRCAFANAVVQIISLLVDIFSRQCVMIHAIIRDESVGPYMKTVGNPSNMVDFCFLIILLLSLSYYFVFIFFRIK